MIPILLLLVAVLTSIFIAKFLGHRKKEYQSLRLMQNFYLYMGGIIIFITIVYSMAIAYILVSDDLDLRGFVARFRERDYNIFDLIKTLSIGLCIGIFLIGMSQLVEILLDIKSTLTKNNSKSNYTTDN